MSKQIRLVKPHLPALEDIADDLRTILASGMLTNFGPFSKSLESKSATLLGVAHALLVSNATNGLTLLMNTLPEGSEVLVPSFTFLPTVQGILWNRLTPVFVDIDPETYNISPEAAKDRLTEKTSAMVGVNVFGAPCAIEALQTLADAHGIKLFLDSAHAFGAKHGGVYLGGFGDAEVFSHSATKLLPCGEGGLITTNDDTISQAIRDRRNYGFKDKTYDCWNRGLNGKITEFSAILGLRGIETIDERVHRRNEIAQHYAAGLRDLPGLRFQKILPGDLSTCKDFTLVVDQEGFGMDRGALRSKLLDRGIETASYFSPAIDRMTYFADAPVGQEPLKNTNYIESRILSLPIYFDLSDEEVEYVIDAIQAIFQENH